MIYVQLFLSNKWCSILNVTLMVIVHKIFIHSKLNEHWLYEDLLLTRLHSSCIYIHDNNPPLVLYFNEL